MKPWNHNRGQLTKFIAMYLFIKERDDVRNTVYSLDINIVIMINKTSISKIKERKTYYFEGRRG